MTFLSGPCLSAPLLLWGSLGGLWDQTQRWSQYRLWRHQRHLPTQTLQETEIHTDHGNISSLQNQSTYEVLTNIAVCGFALLNIVALTWLSLLCSLMNCQTWQQIWSGNFTTSVDCFNAYACKHMKWLFVRELPPTHAMSDLNAQLSIPLSIIFCSSVFWGLGKAPITVGFRSLLCRLSPIRWSRIRLYCSGAFSAAEAVADWSEVNDIEASVLFAGAAMLKACGLRQPPLFTVYVSHTQTLNKNTFVNF